MQVAASTPVRDAAVRVLKAQTSCGSLSDALAVLALDDAVSYAVVQPLETTASRARRGDVAQVSLA